MKDTAAAPFDFAGIDRRILLAIIIAGLGYFVDAFDILIFSVVRSSSLRSLGLNESDVLDYGIYLLNIQLFGMLLGGLLWGVIGDRVGRIKILFGSILTYSIANLLNAAVTNVDQYAVLRFVSGVGLAGEIGAGITLVSELMPAKQRGLGTMIVAFLGVMGAAAAGLVGELLPWRASFLVGGLLGLVLLCARLGLEESSVFQVSRMRSGVKRGSLTLMFSNPARVLRFVSLIVAGMPVWFVVGIVVTLSPELAKALQMDGTPQVGVAVGISCFMAAIGDLLSGTLSQKIKSRRSVMLLMITCVLAICTALFNTHGLSVLSFYVFLGVLGLAAGYWAVLITTAAEQFGTNLRATAATSIPNFVRGATTVMSMTLVALKPEHGVIWSAQVIILCVTVAAGIAVLCMRETFGIELNYDER